MAFPYSSRGSIYKTKDRSGIQNRYDTYQPIVLNQSKSPSNCKTKYESVYITKCKNVPKHVCKKVRETRYKIVYEPKCHVVKERICSPDVRETNGKSCDEKSNQICYIVPKDVPYGFLVNRCTVVRKRVCKKVLVRLVPKGCDNLPDYTYAI